MLDDDPLWYKDAIIYELHVRAFHDSVGDGVGDFRGLTQKLDYLEDLGVTVLYFNPIFESPSNHKYDTANYGVISQDFGSLSDFEALVADANSRGISIVLDGVFNHTSSDSAYFDRYSRYDAAGNLTSPGGPGTNDGSGACESPSSPYRSWYYFTDVPAGTGPCTGSGGTPGVWAALVAGSKFLMMRSPVDEERAWSH